KFFKDSSVLIRAQKNPFLYLGVLGGALWQPLTLGVTGFMEFAVHPGRITWVGVYSGGLNGLGAKGTAFSLHDNALDKGPLTLNAPTTGTLAADVADAWWLDATAGQVINLTLGTSSADSFLGLALKRPDGSLANVQVTDRVGGAVIHQALLDQ